MQFPKILTILALLCGTAAAQAQPRFVPETPDVKVGEVIFQNPKTIRYTVTNKGNKPLVIKEVRPSCGCTEATWTKSPIAAGAQGIITATYDARIMGTFHKELAVYTNAGDDPVYLSFQGRVVETALDYTGDFPIDLGSLRLSTNYIEFDDVNRGEKPQVEFEVANLERGNYTPELMHLPPYLTAEYVPSVIAGGRVGKIRLTLDSDKLYFEGLNQCDIYLSRFQGDRVGAKNDILVSAVLLPPFDNLTAEQMERAPQLVLSEDEIDIDFMGKKKMTKVIDVTNIGEETLTIRKMQVFNRAVTVSLSDRNIGPHKTAKLKITVTAKDLTNRQNYPRVLLISNDPRHAKTILPINVKE